MRSISRWLARERVWSLGRRATRKVLVPSAVAVVVLSLFTSSAYAADSGYQFIQQVDEHSGQVKWCGEASIVATAQNRSWVLTNKSPTQCVLGSNEWVAPAGYQGAEAYGFFNGNLCGATGYFYNSTPTATFGVGQNVCGDKGCGVYSTVAAQALWGYYYGGYYGGGQQSPNQNYYCGATSSSAGTSSPQPLLEVNNSTFGPLTSSTGGGGTVDWAAAPDFIAVAGPDSTVVGYVAKAALQSVTVPGPLAGGSFTPTAAEGLPVVNTAQQVVGTLYPGEAGYEPLGSPAPSQSALGAGVQLYYGCLAAAAC
jgi:hypothetical protein